MTRRFFFLIWRRIWGCFFERMAAAFCGKEKLNEKQKTLIQSLIEELGDDLDC